MCTAIVYKMTDKGKSVTRERPHGRKIAANANLNIRLSGGAWATPQRRPTKNFPP